MGREIRKVPNPDVWQHPWDTESQQFVRICGETVTEHMARKAQEFLDYLAEAPDKDDQPPTYAGWIEWDGGFYDPEELMPDLPRTHYALYENVSEGTPLSPAFWTLSDLERWLVENPTWQEYRRYTPEEARALVENEWAPSAFIINGEVVDGVVGLLRIVETEA